MPLLIIAAVIVLVIGGASLLFSGRSAGADGIDGESIMHVAYLGVLASFVGFGMFSGGWRNIRKDIRDFFFWIGAMLLLTGIYAFKDDFKLVGNRMLATLIPGRAVSEGGEYVVTRSAGGMFLLDGQVNGQNIRFIFDTGASGVSLSAADAQRAGVVTRPSDYSIEVRTANGTAMVAAVILDTLTVGGITVNNVRAFVSREGAMSRSLLGHSFLDKLKSYEVRGDRLILRGS